MMRVSPLVRKNVRVVNYHCRFVLPTNGDSPSSRRFAPATNGDDVLLIAVVSSYEPALKTFFTASLSYDMAAIAMLQHNKIRSLFK
jgi:hypothetical protein